MTQVLLLLAVAIVVAAPIFLAARESARKSGATRARLILGASIGIAAGLVAALWLPGMLPQTQGSPATIVGMLLLWILGGGFAFLFAAMLGGALLGKTRNGTEI